MWYEFVIGILVILIIIFIIIVIILYSRGALKTVGPQGPQGATGSTGGTGPPGTTKSFVTLNPGGNYIDGNFIFFGNQSVAIGVSAIVISDTGFISNLFVDNQHDQGVSGAQRQYTLIQNGNSTTQTVTLSGLDTQGFATGSIVLVSPGDTIAVLYQEMGTGLPATTGAITFTINKTN